MTEIKKVFDGLISRLDMVKERIPKPKDMIIVEEAREKDRKIGNRTSKNCGTTTKVVPYI